jgi:hypothetical protein
LLHGWESAEICDNFFFVELAFLFFLGKRFRLSTPDLNLFPQPVQPLGDVFWASSTITIDF